MFAIMPYYGPQLLVSMALDTVQMHADDFYTMLDARPSQPGPLATPAKATLEDKMAVAEHLKAA